MNNELFKSLSRAYFKPFEMWEEGEKSAEWSSRGVAVYPPTFFPFLFEWKRNSPRKIIIYIFGIASHSLTSFEIAHKKNSSSKQQSRKRCFRIKSHWHTFSGREKKWALKTDGFSWLHSPLHVLRFSIWILNHRVQRQCSISFFCSAMRLPKIWPQRNDEYGSSNGISSNSKYNSSKTELLNEILLVAIHSGKTTFFVMRFGVFRKNDQSSRVNEVCF